MTMAPGCWRSLGLATAAMCCGCAARAERADDEIKQLPGWEGELPSRQFSGMVNAKEWGGQMHQQHYWCVQFFPLVSGMLSCSELSCV